MQRAKNIKNDEFYTQYQDIAAECDHYLDQFRNKVIYCNCDTECSNFVRYFLNLKSQGIIRDVIWSGGLGGIDFRSPESVAMLQQADVVVTNPPFSLFRQYVAQLIESGKQFLILGNQNAVSYKDFFPLFMSGQVRLGYKSFGPLLFDVPVVEPDKTYKVVNGVPKAVVAVCWFTNLQTPDKKGLVLSKRYFGNESCYPKYDNIDAINVSRIKDIPMDYDGLIGVPITFMGCYNPAQFVLVGLDEELTYNRDRCTINGQRLYARIFIRKKSASVVANDNDNLTVFAA